MKSDKSIDRENKMPELDRMRPGGARGRRLMGPPPKTKDLKGTLKRLIHYMLNQKVKLLLVVVMLIISAFTTLIGPYFIGVAIDAYIMQQDYKGLMILSLFMLVMYLINALSTWLSNYWMIQVAERTVATIRRDLFSVIQKLPLSYFDQHTHGEMMSRLTNDVENISNTLSNTTTQVFSSSIILIGTMGMMVWMSPILTVVSLIILPMMFFLSKQITSRTRHHFSEQQRKLGEINGFIEETISGQKEIKTFAREEKMIGEFLKMNQGLKKSSIKAQTLSGLIFPMMNVLNNLSFAIVAGVGGWLVVEQMATVGVIASFTNYAKQFTRPLNDLANQFNMVLSAIAGAERVFEVLDEPLEPSDGHNIEPLKTIEGNITFEKVSFAYVPSEPVIKSFDLEVKAGQTIAIVGPTGAGKTTIVNLLTRFYETDQGQMMIDGIDIKNIKRDQLRSALGIVLQDTYLFSGSVEENIRYGRLNATEDDIKRAASLAHADGFISRLPNGYKTCLGEDGSGLSQGQRQLIAIARVILADPKILILDEATSSVDTRTELYIQKAMNHLMKGRTSFVIAHRLSTVEKADKIIVLHQGNMIESGKHTELLKQKGFYYNLYQSAFKSS